MYPLWSFIADSLRGVMVLYFRVAGSMISGISVSQIPGKSFGFIPCLSSLSRVEPLATNRLGQSLNLRVCYGKNVSRASIFKRRNSLWNMRNLKSADWRHGRMKFKPEVAGRNVLEFCGKYYGTRWSPCVSRSPWRALVIKEMKRYLCRCA